MVICICAVTGLMTLSVYLTSDYSPSMLPSVSFSTTSTSIERESGHPTSISSGGAGDGSDSSVIPEMVEINTANVEELMTLPGIGEVIAQRIIHYREENGPFSYISEIQQVKGIGEKTYEQIRSRIYIKGQPEEAAPSQQSSQDSGQGHIKDSSAGGTTKPPPRSSVPADVKSSSSTAAHTSSSAVSVPSSNAETEESSSRTPPQFPLDLNQVTYEELVLLEGITPDIARGIISLREQISYFSSLYELRLVEGLDDQTIAKIYHYFYIGPPQSGS